MELGIFSVLDAKTQAYMQPFFAVTPGAAIRSFTDAVSDPTTLLYSHPEDFHLYQIGMFDDHLGTVNSTEPQPLGNALQYKDQALENSRT